MTNDKNRRGIDPAVKLSELREGGKKPTDPTLLEAEEIEDGSDDTFGVRSPDRNQKVMLELRFQTGNAKALAYSYLVSADFDPSEGIDLDFSAYTVRLLGRNLRPVYAGIVAQRVAFVQEVEELAAEVTHPPDAPVITQIVVRSPIEGA
jgi:hypothetical protein